MSNKLILCEGKTDAILLSYYLDKKVGWKASKAPKGVDIKCDPISIQSAYWYRKEDEYLLICGVGGVDKFGNFFNDKIKSPLIDSSAFSKIAIVIDRDERNEKEICDSLKKDFSPIILNLENKVWCRNQIKNSYDKELSVDALLIIIPQDKFGAIETLLLDCISENNYDKNIVDECKKFVNMIEPQAKKYLSKRRLKLKSQLSVTWAIMSPEKVFHFIDEQIRSYPWEESMILEECYYDLLSI